jgi:hypothetical protein
MRQLRRLKLSYANVIATLALFLALGGGAYATTQLPKNSVGTEQLRKESVRAGKMAPESVNRKALGEGIRKRLDEPGPVGPQGQTGSRGAVGPSGPGAVRLHLSEDGTAAATPQPIGTVGGLTIKVACKTTEGETRLIFAVSAEEAGTIQENFQNDSGANPHEPGETQSGNLQIDLPRGDSTLGGPPGVPSGAYFRTLAFLIYATPKQTASLQLAAVADGSTSHCTADGVGVPTGG